jgi:hypothetical protein
MIAISALSRTHEVVAVDALKRRARLFALEHGRLAFVDDEPPVHARPQPGSQTARRAR